MRFHFRSAAPAPLEHVRYVLGALDEYPSWSSAVRRGPAEMRWAVELPALGPRMLDVGVDRDGDSTTIVLGRRTLLRFELEVEVVPAGRLHSDVRVATTVSGPLALLATRAVVVEMVERFCSEAVNRARWLPQAPDTRFPELVLDARAHPGSNASLERLKSCARALEGGIFAIDGSSSCCLVDPARNRFLRVEPGSDLARLVTFARWRSYERIVCDGDDVVIVPGAGVAPIRIRPRSGPPARDGDTRLMPADPRRTALRAGPKSVPA